MSRNLFDSSTLQARQRLLQQVRAAGAGEREQLGQVQGGCTVLYDHILYCTVRSYIYCTVLYCTFIYCTVLYCSARWRDTAAEIISRYRTDSSGDTQVTPQEFIRKEG